MSSPQNLRDLSQDELIKHITDLYEGIENAHTFHNKQRELISALESEIKSLQTKNDILQEQNQNLSEALDKNTTELENTKLELQKEKDEHTKTDKKLHWYEQDSKKMQKQLDKALETANEFRLEKNEAIAQASNQKALADTAFKKIGQLLKESKKTRRGLKTINIENVTVNHYHDDNGKETFVGKQTTIQVDQDGNYKPKQ